MTRQGEDPARTGEVRQGKARRGEVRKGEARQDEEQRETTGERATQTKRGEEVIEGR